MIDVCLDGLERGQIKNLIDVCLEPLEVQQQHPSIAGWGGLVGSMSIPCQSVGVLWPVCHLLPVTFWGLSVAISKGREEGNRLINGIKRQQNRFAENGASKVKNR